MLESRSMTAPNLRIASYNIQKCVGLDLRRQPRRILTVLSAIGADIIALQEADKRLPPRPAALPHFVIEEAGFQAVDLGGAGSLGWHGNAILWRGNSVSLRDKGHIPLPGLEPRGAVWALFDTPIGALRVVGAHLGLVPASRRDQVLELRADLEAFCDVATIWAGDFNDWSKGASLTGLAPQMRFLPPLASFPALRPIAPLDRLALSSELQAQNHGVYRNQPAQIASDHLPLWADIVRCTGQDAESL